MTVNTSLSTPSPLSICVVIPAYNESTHITACLTSLYEQARLPDEVIIVDNNCMDDTVMLAGAFPVTIIQEPIQGICPARALGYDTATNAGHDIIVCTDADARFPYEWLGKIEAAFIGHPERIAITGPGKFYDGNQLENKLGCICYMSLYFRLVGSAIGVKPLFGSNFAMRTSVWKQVCRNVHYVDDSVHDDIDLTYHLLDLGRLYYSKNLYNYISIRPMKSIKGMIIRTRKGFTSIMCHWPDQSPVVLYRQKIMKSLVKHDKNIKTDNYTT